MNNEARTLWLSLGSGLFAAFLLYSYSQEKKAEYDRKFGTLKNVVVAAQDIGEMVTIDDTMLEVIQRPADFLEPSSIQDQELIVGQVAATPIKKGEQILTNKLLQLGPSTGIALQVAPTKRAVTLPIDEVRGVAKLMKPGDRIDIYAAVDSGKGVNSKREVSLIMQDVVILATGINVLNNIPRKVEVDNTGKNLQITPLTGDTNYNTVTIEASPKEAQDLIYIYSTSPSNLFFTLRNPNDRAIPPRMPSSTSDSVLGRPVIDTVAAPLPPPPAPMPMVPKRLPPKKSPGGYKDL
jgi:pilus assembly protein CpaB